MNDINGMCSWNDDRVVYYTALADRPSMFQIDEHFLPILVRVIINIFYGLFFASVLIFTTTKKAGSCLILSSHLTGVNPMYSLELYNMT
jgi:hypothetical protein